MKISLLAVAVAIFAISGFIQAETSEQYIYKWKDEQGMVHYTERRPESGVTFERVRRESDSGSKTSTTAAASKAGKNVEQIADDSYSSWQKENCKIANQNLDVLLNAGRIAQDDGQGGTRLMTDEEKAEKIQKMTEQRDKYCKAEDTEQ